MNQLPDDILLQLRRYANGELSGDERLAMESLLREHPDLQEELDLTKALIAATEKAERARLFQLVGNISAQFPVEPEAVPARPLFGRLTSTRNMAIAAALALVLMAGWWWLQRLQDPFKAFDQSSYIPPSLPQTTLRGGAGNMLSTAATAYQNQKYPESLQALEGISDADSLYAFALFLKGHDYYQMARYEDAVTILTALDTLARNKYLLPSQDNTGWTRILAIYAIYRRAPSDDGREKLDQALQAFLASANKNDKYWEKAATLRSLLWAGPDR